MKTRLILAASLVALLAVAVYFLFRPEPATKGKERANILIDWIPEPTYLGFYYAEDLGLYDRAGLDVRIENVQGANRAIATLNAGGFDLSAASGAATALSYNEYENVVSVGVIYPRVATAIYGLAGKGIERPADLAGKRVGIYPGSINNQEFGAFLDQHRIARDSVEVVALSGSDVALILEGRIDAAVNYDELSPQLLRTQLEKMGRSDKVWSFKISDDVDLGYGLNLIALRDKSRKQIVRRLADAIYEGYRTGCARPAEAVAAYTRRFPETDKSYVARSWQVVCSQLGDPVGGQNEAGWANTIAAVKRFDMLRKDIEPQRIVWQD